MKRGLFISGVLFMIIACSKNKYEFKPDSTCDLANIRYNDTLNGISLIIKYNCSRSPCHSHPPTDSTLTLDFTTYEGVKREAGSIYNRINRPVDDPLHMPKGLPGEAIGQTMDTCELAKLNTWILMGAPEN
jgi:hypothetical protein